MLWIVDLVRTDSVFRDFLYGRSLLWYTRAMNIKRFLFGALAALVGSAGAASVPSFADFDARARAGERLNVVFLGCSLTWGCNATDHARTSYRAIVARQMEAKYPDAHFAFHDAAIGGTDALLSVFRLDRDVFSREPDLVFFDSTANDGLYDADPDKLAAYESTVRRLTERGVPVVAMIFGFRNDMARSKFPTMKRRDAHLAIAKAYGCGVGDAIEHVTKAIESGATSAGQLWPFDIIHPCDKGYALFAEAAWAGFEEAVAEKRVGTVPSEMLHGTRFEGARRVRLADHANALPKGWIPAPCRLDAICYDFLCSRWMDGVVRGANFKTVREGDWNFKNVDIPAPAPLKFRTNATWIAVFGESTNETCDFAVSVDGAEPKPVHFNRWGGNGYLRSTLASDLEDGKEHEITILPTFVEGKIGELRLDSVLLAGAAEPSFTIVP